MTERPPIEAIAKKVADGSELTAEERRVASAIIMAVGQNFYEKTGAMFISGYTGEIKPDGLPDTLFITPSYGADFRCTARFVRSEAPTRTEP